MKTKVCTKCGIEKAVSEFYKAKREKDGHMHSCKTCLKTYYLKQSNFNTCRIKINHPIYFKICTKCGEIKNISEYYKDKHSGHGYLFECKQCTYKIKQSRNNKISCNIKNNIDPIFKACKKCEEVNRISEYSIYKNYPNLCQRCAKDKITKSNNNNTCRIHVKSKIYFKVCSRCKELKHIGQYNHNSKSNNRYETYCRRCRSDVQRKRLKISVCKIDIKGKIYFKVCTKCNRLLSISNFNKNKTYQSKHGSHCKNCLSSVSKLERDNLSEGYIVNSLGLNKEKVPEGLMIAKRSQLKLYRAIKRVSA